MVVYNLFLLLLSSFIVPALSSIKRRYEPAYYFVIGFSFVILSLILWGLRTITLIAPSIYSDKERSERSNLEKTEFFINLAHEVKTPLTLISNYMDEYI